MMPLITSILAVLAALISVLTFVSSQIAQRNAVSREAMRNLERRVLELEDIVTRMKEREESLIRENIELLRRLARMENGGKV
jgi:uncharacterized membrane protein (DUF106 family)